MQAIQAHEVNRQRAVTRAVTRAPICALTYQFVAIYWVSQANLRRRLGHGHADLHPHRGAAQLLPQGIAVLEDTLELNGASIESTASDAAADLSHDGLAHDADHKVNWQQSGGGAGS